jgi:hypothetical protein
VHAVRLVYSHLTLTTCEVRSSVTYHSQASRIMKFLQYLLTLIQELLSIGQLRRILSILDQDCPLPPSGPPSPHSLGTQTGKQPTFDPASTRQATVRRRPAAVRHSAGHPAPGQGPQAAI